MPDLFFRMEDHADNRPSLTDFCKHIESPVSWISSNSLDYFCERSTATICILSIPCRRNACLSLIM